MTHGLGNNLLAYVNGLLLSLCMGRALAINSEDAYPLDPVLDFVLEKDIAPWPGWQASVKGARLASTQLFLDQADDLSQVCLSRSSEVTVHHVGALLCWHAAHGGVGASWHAIAYSGRHTLEKT